jgi:hypothetical protein
MKVIKIKKGNHLASNQFTGVRFGMFDNGQIGAIVRFGRDARYLTKDPANQMDWNKLLGCSWGFNPLLKQFQMHENSSRWVWRWNNAISKFQVAPYIYVNGECIWAEKGGFPIIDLNIDEPICLWLVPDKSKSEVYFRFTKDIASLNISSHANNFKEKINLSGLETLFTTYQPIPSISGFIAPGYFGGTETAPHDICYDYLKLS